MIEGTIELSRTVVNADSVSVSDTKSDLKKERAASEESSDEKAKVVKNTILVVAVMMLVLKTSCIRVQ